MGNVVTFNEAIKLVEVHTPPVDGIVYLDVKIDLYSDGKEDWLAAQNLRKFPFPVRAVGGDPLPGSKSLGSTFFLDSEWKIGPYESNHRFAVNGNLYSEDGTSPFAATTGNFNVFLEQQVSSLVDSTVIQLKEIEYASFNGVICIDITSPYSGVDYPTGTPQQPVNNIADAYLIAIDRGILVFDIIGNLPLTSSTPDLAQFTFLGGGKDRTHIDIDAVAQVDNCAYYEAHILGTLDGNSRLKDCLIDNLIYVKGYIEQCVLAPGTIVLAGSEEAHFLDCWSGQPGTGTPTIDMGGAGQALALRNYNGGIKLINKTGPEAVSIDLNSGQIKLDMTTVTNGIIVARGIGKLIDDATGLEIKSGTYGSLEILNEIVNIGNIATGTWESGLNEFNSPATFGGAINSLGYFDHMVYIDTESLINGNGTQNSPYNNLTDAIDFAEAKNIRHLVVLSDIIIDRQLKNFKVRGVGTPTVDCNGQALSKCEFWHCAMEGAYTGIITVQESVLLTGFYLNGFFEKCALQGTLYCPAGAAINLIGCVSNIPGTGTPIIDMNNGLVGLSIRGYNGGIKLINKAGAESVSIDMVSGQARLDMTTVLNGTIVARGVGKLVDDATGIEIKTGTYGSLEILNEIVNVWNVSDGVWDKDKDELTNTQSIGNFIYKKLLKTITFLGNK